MAKTEADKEGWQSKKKNGNSIVPEVFDKELTKDDLIPVKGLDFDEFARSIARLKDNPDKFSKTFTGWIHRFKLKRHNRAVEEMYRLMDSTRIASQSQLDLQTQLIKAKITYYYQVELAVMELKNEKELQQARHNLEIFRLDVEKSKMEFQKKFYDKADPQNLTESDKLLLALMHIKSSSSTYTSLDGHSSSYTEKGDPAEILKFDQQKDLFNLYIRERNAEIDSKITQNEKETHKVREAKSDADYKEYKKDAKIKKDKEV